MKRVIKFWNKFSDKGFSDCGTEYEVLPILVDDNAGPKELRAIAKQLGIKTSHKVITVPVVEGYRRGATHATHMLKTGQKTEPKFFEKKEYDWYLGFVTLNEKAGILKPSQKLGKRITGEQADEIMQERAYGLADVGDFSMVPKKDDRRIIMEGWNYYHEIKMLGYDLDKFERMVTHKRKSQDGDREFEDGVFSCSECGTWDSNDSGYTYNYRIVHGEQLGINCGCHDEHCKSSLLDYIGDHREVLEGGPANELAEDGMLEHVERYIGGMTDGRGGSYGGESTREGTPEGVMKEWQAKEPKSKFVMSHDESGQFQSYFSIWRVTKKALTQNGRKAA